ncbi:MAG: exodeoxyribonuclease IX [Thermoanaerobaculia bacterium]|nr:exodeoxyribonuclease IX [Thermoanaerobaculia bacterium]
MPATHTVYLVDASPYIFRAYFSLPTTMVGKAGTPVNAAYGFAGFLLKLIETEQPTHLGLAFDESLNTSFRNEIYPAYKAQRELPPPELEAQLRWCQQIGRALGAAVYVDDRYEADDLIGTLADQLTRRGHRVVVVTSDKDLAQLVDEQVSLYDFAKEERYDREEVVEKFGVRPEQIPDYLGLAGDAVDNIPGVTGIGPKTAAALLAGMVSLDGLYDRLAEVATLPIRGAKTLPAKLEASRDVALLSRQLATIARDAPVHADLGELALNGADPGLVDPLFEELGFGRIRERIGRWR